MKHVTFNSRAFRAIWLQREHPGLNRDVIVSFLKKLC